MRRTILIVPHWYPWPDAPGAGVWVREQARAVATRHDVALVTAREDPGLRRRYAVHLAEEEGLLVARVRFRAARPIRGAGMLNRRRGLLHALGLLREQGVMPDLVHAHVHAAGFAALALARRTATPLVVSEHHSALALGTLGHAELAAARIAFARAAVVCTPSQALAAAVRPLAGRTPVRVVPNAVDTSVFTPAPHPPSDPVAIVVGALKQGKGHDVLLVALGSARARGSRVSLDVVGDGPLRSALTARARDLGLADAVRFHGALARDQVAERMRAAAFLALPSMWENAPVAASEAAACGLPVVGSDAGGIREIAGDQALLVPPGRPEPLATALMQMEQALPAIDRGALASAARARFGFEAVAAQWERVYAAA